MPPFVLFCYGDPAHGTRRIVQECAYSNGRMPISLSRNAGIIQVNSLVEGAARLAGASGRHDVGHVEAIALMALDMLRSASPIGLFHWSVCGHMIPGLILRLADRFALHSPVPGFTQIQVGCLHHDEQGLPCPSWCFFLRRSRAPPTCISQPGRYAADEPAVLAPSSNASLRPWRYRRLDGGCL